MAYIGTNIPAGNYRKLTDISSSFNGVTTTFTLSVPPGTLAYYVTPTSNYQLLISVGGVIQEPDTDYTVSGNQITFSTAPAAGLTFFGVLMGDALNVGTPSDGTVTAAKLNATGGLEGQTFVINSSGQFVFGSPGATGASGDRVFYLNDQTVNNDYTIVGTQNAMSAGPITIASGVTVTVASGATWTVV